MRVAEREETKLAPIRVSDSGDAPGTANAMPHKQIIPACFRSATVRNLRPSQTFVDWCGELRARRESPHRQRWDSTRHQIRP